MIPFDAAHKAVHYPPDRRFRVWIRPSFVAGAVVLILLPLLFAWDTRHFRVAVYSPVPQFNEASRLDRMAFRCGSAMHTSLIFYF